MELNFRTLNADEIECRVKKCTQNGAQILLYKDARCDMAILDETVGPMNWQRLHGRENANCIVSIWDAEKKQWVEKEDTGTESNTEAEKGLASDSFKRSCVNWGIGRELYTAPFIWIQGVTEQDKNTGKWVCTDNFKVSSIAYDNKRRISAVAITNKKNETVFSYKARSAPVNAPLFRCEKCGGELKVYTGADGRPVSLRKHAEGSKAKFGKILCLDCIKKQQLNLDGLRQQALHDDAGDRE